MSRMSLESRSSSALIKRAEQVKRWKDSDTNLEPAWPKSKQRKIKFSSGCMFLAACAAGDEEEVLGLLQKDVDINTANVDGLTALHQACIDDDLDMVEYLVKHGADVNRGDNEGWTPLHATASCGFLSIAKFLIDNGANIAAVNCDGQLALDIAESEEMETLLQAEIKAQGIDCDQARSAEERLMLNDAKEWLNTKSSEVDVGNSKTGATPLHVASAKGYGEVMKILLQCGADIDKQDVDGWTPLHAAAHWGQKEACKILVDNLADMDAKNFVGQTPIDLADSDMYKFLMDLKDRQNKEEVNKRQAKKRAEAQDTQHHTETPPKVKRVEVEIEKEKEKNVDEIIGMEVSSESETESSSTSSESESSEEASENEIENETDEKKNKVNSQGQNNEIMALQNDISENAKGPPSSPPKQIPEGNSEDSMPSWRRPNSRQVNKVDTTVKSSNSFRNKNSPDSTNENEVQLRRTNSFQSDPAFYERYRQLRARIQATSYPSPSKTSTNIFTHTNDEYIIPLSNIQRQFRSKEESGDSTPSSTSTTTTTTSPTKTTSPATSPQPTSQPVRSGLKLALTGANTPVSSAPQSTATTPTTTNTTPSTPTTPGGTRLTMIKNFFKSFVPPVRDEESETQRKAHAKRVRETRRSTQGVTLEEIKSAEQLVKKKNQTTNNNNNEQSVGANGDQSNGVSVTATITTATPTVVTRDTAPPTTTTTTSSTTEEPTISHERRPSWRLRVDNGSKFKLEDVNKVSEPPSFIRRPGLPTTTTQRPSSAPVDSAETTVTLSLRRPKSVEEKEQDKENDARNAQATLATQAAIQRRRRPKRRSTGVVAFDSLDDMDQDKESNQGGGGDYDDQKANHQESGNDRSTRSSRINSSSDLVLRGENGEIDYKKLYEQTLTENERLKDKLKKTDEELKDTKQTLEKLNTVTSKNSLSELEKRERRAMERKLSEMEEELKQLELLKTENQRLKDENGALIRVISKLSK